MEDASASVGTAKAPSSGKTAGAGKSSAGKQRSVTELLPDERVAVRSFSLAWRVTSAPLDRLLAYRRRTLAGMTAAPASSTGAEAFRVSEISVSVAAIAREPGLPPSPSWARKRTPCRTGMVERVATARATLPRRSASWPAVVVIFMGFFLSSQAAVVRKKKGGGPGPVSWFRMGNDPPPGRAAARPGGAAARRVRMAAPQSASGEARRHRDTSGQGLARGFQIRPCSLKL